MKNLNIRQELIINFINNNNGISTKDILIYVNKELEENIVRMTIVRDIDKLITKQLIERKGRGRGVKYFSIKNPLLKYFDVNKYFESPPDKRTIKHDGFNFGLFKQYKKIIDEDEINDLKGLNKNYRNRIRDLPTEINKKEIERLSIEFVWKSSQIEGNTYSLLETEFLIKENRKASGHSKNEALMILNQKRAIDYLFARKENFKKIDINKIIKLHDIIIKDLGISHKIRSKPVGITGTNYQPIRNKEEIVSALKKTVEIINFIEEPLEKALLANILIAYIQPFNDGNKRISRLLGNAVLLAYNYCPLSFRSIDDYEYKKAVLLFYEQNSILYFKELFIEQFKFAVDNYFL